MGLTAFKTFVDFKTPTKCYTLVSVLFLRYFPYTIILMLLSLYTRGICVHVSALVNNKSISFKKVMSRKDISILVSLLKSFIGSWSSQCLEAILFCCTSRFLWTAPQGKGKQLFFYFLAFSLCFCFVYLPLLQYNTESSINWGCFVTVE